MAWIESINISQDPKTFRLMTLLGIAKAQAIGHLHLVWWWSLSYAPKGDLSAVCDMAIADAASWDGNPATLRTALQTSGWIQPDGYLASWKKIARVAKVDANRRSRSRRRARIRGTESTLTAEQWVAIQEYFGGRCAYCMKSVDNLTIDHVEPISRGGNDTAENIVPACKSCNSRKHNHSMLEFVTGMKLKTGTN